jgi:predicted DNA binding CopG/RHH family protein
MSPHDALDDYEADILAAYEQGDVKPNGASKSELEKYRLAADLTLAHKKSVSIRLSTPDFIDVQARAMQEGLSYQNLITSVLHKYLTGHLTESPRPATSRSSFA